jgi:dihydrofolate reductase
MDHAMIMGRKTFDSIGKPLRGRRSVVLTHQLRLDLGPNIYEDVYFVHTFVDAITKALEFDESPFIIGGGEVFRQSLPYVSRIYRTIIETEIEGDTLFPSLSASEWMVGNVSTFPSDAKNEFPYRFEELTRISGLVPLQQHESSFSSQRAGTI